MHDTPYEHGSIAHSRMILGYSFDAPFIQEHLTGQPTDAANKAIREWEEGWYNTQQFFDDMEDDDDWYPVECAECGKLIHSEEDEEASYCGSIHVSCFSAHQEHCEACRE